MSKATSEENSAYTKLRRLAQGLGLQAAIDGGIKIKNGAWTPPMTHEEARRYLKGQLADRHLNRAGSTPGRRQTDCLHSDPACAACIKNRERVNARNATLRAQRLRTGVALHARGTTAEHALCGAAFNDDFADGGQTVTCELCQQQIAYVRRAFTSSNRVRRLK